MGFQPNLRIAYTIFAELLQPSLIIPADFGNNKMSFQASTILKMNSDLFFFMNDEEKIEKIVDRINFWEHKEVISDENKDVLIKEIKEIIEYRY